VWIILRVNTSEAKDITSSSFPDLPTDKPHSSEVARNSILKNQLRHFILLLIAVTCARVGLLLLSPLDLSPDEAHYWEWSRKLDWSYYSKGPVIAWLVALSTTIWGNTEWAVRFPALLLSIALMGSMYWFLARIVGSHLAFWSIAILNSGVFFFSLGLGMTTDTPCLLAWFLTLIFAHKAVFEEASSKSWQWAGVCAGMAALSKYTAIFIFPAFLFTFLLIPALRPQIRTHRFWWGWAISLIALFPVVLWNYKNGWVNFLHNSNHLIPQRGGQLHMGNILEVVTACAFMVGPILMFVLAHFIWKDLRTRVNNNLLSPNTTRICFFLIPGISLLVICLLVALQKRVYPNWIAPTFLYLTVAASFMWKSTTSNRQVYRKWIRAGLSFNCIVIIIGAAGVLGFTWGLPLSRLPLRKLMGWRELGAAVNTLTLSLGDTSMPIVTDSYELASELAFYIPNHPEIYCARVDERRMNQYDIWGGWDTLKGKRLLIVLRNDHVPESLSVHFKEIQTIEKPFSFIRNGEALRTLYFYSGTEYDGAAPEHGAYF